MKIASLKNYQINRNQNVKTNTSKTVPNFNGIALDEKEAETIKKEYNITTGARINNNIHEMLKILTKNAFNPEHKMEQIQTKITALAPLLCDDTIITAYSNRFNDSIIVSHPVFKYTIAKDYSTQTYGCPPDINNSDVCTLARHINEQIAYGKEKGWINNLHSRYTQQKTELKTDKMKSPANRIIDKIEKAIIYATGVSSIAAATALMVDGCESNTKKIKDKTEIKSEISHDSTHKQNDIEYHK